MFAHTFEFLLHDGVLVDDGVLRLELVVVFLYLLSLLLLELDPGQGQRHLWVVEVYLRRV